jgi:hypothetical protein
MDGKPHHRPAHRASVPEVTARRFRGPSTNGAIAALGMAAVNWIVSAPAIIGRRMPSREIFSHRHPSRSRSNGVRTAEMKPSIAA